MTSELPFNGFNEHITAPLASSDQRSFLLIKQFFIQCPNTPEHPFTMLVQKLTGKILPENEALVCWQQIVKHKIMMQQKLGRTVGIQTAAIDYFEYQSPGEPHFRNSDKPVEKKATPVTNPEKNQSSMDYRLEKLKEEIFRAKRYKHALSAIMLDIDNFHIINDTIHFKAGDKILATTVQIIKKTIRNVDFVSRMSGDRFLIILPNTNQREAKELAERIKVRIVERTRKLRTLPDGLDGITATFSVGQCTNNDTSMDFIRRIEHVLDEGKRKNRNIVYACE